MGGWVGTDRSSLFFRNWWWCFVWNANRWRWMLRWVSLRSTMRRFMIFLVSLHSEIKLLERNRRWVSQLMLQMYESCWIFAKLNETRKLDSWRWFSRIWIPLIMLQVAIREWCDMPFITTQQCCGLPQLCRLLYIILACIRVQSMHECGVLVTVGWWEAWQPSPQVTRSY